MTQEALSFKHEQPRPGGGMGAMAPLLVYEEMPECSDVKSEMNGIEAPRSKLQGIFDRRER